MSPIPLAAVIAVFVMPLVSAIEVWRHPLTSWERIGYRRWFWGTAPAIGTLLSPVLGTLVPSFLAFAIAAVYAAKVRPLLTVADGRPRPTSPFATLLTEREQNEVGVLLLSGIAILLFAAFVTATAQDWGDRLIGLGIATGLTVGGTARIRYIIRGARSR